MSNSEPSELRYGRRLLEVVDASRKNLALYPPDHPFVVQTINQAEFVLGDMFLSKDEVTLSLSDGEFYLNDQALKRESMEFGRLARHLEERGATHMSFGARVTASEIHALFIVLARPAHELEMQGGVRMAIAGAGVSNIRVGRTVSLDPSQRTSETAALGDNLEANLEDAKEGYHSAVGNLKNAFLQIAGVEQVDYRIIKATTEALIDNFVSNKKAWSYLLNMKHYDDYTFNHSVNVATIAMLIAAQFDVLPETLSRLGEAALLHDLGKQKVPVEIIQKSGALSDEEWMLVKSHPERGAKMLVGVRDVTQSAMMVAYEHHVRFDHKGYPKVRQRELHLFTHIVSVADLYDALTSDRGYRRALLPDMAMRIILSQSGTAVHPLVVKVFLNLVGLYPVGTFVRLKTGEIAIVEENGRDLLRPNVKILLEKDGTLATPRERELGREPGLEPPIDGSVDLSSLGIDLTRAM